MIQIKPSHKGMLHQALGVRQGQKISIGALMKAKSTAKRTGNVKLERQATFASNARKWGH